MAVSVPQRTRDRLAVVEEWGGPLGTAATTLLYTYRVWQRNRDAFLRQWTAEAGGFLVEPIIMLVAMGFGLGAYVGEIQGVSYASFVAPGILVAYAMFHSAFEATFGSYMRMDTHKIFDGIIVTPVNVRELILGEAAWAATRSLLAGVAVLLIATLLGLIHSPWALLALPIAYLTGLVFAAMALMLVAVAPSIGTLNNFFTVFITPMFFFSGIFFPLERFPDLLEKAAWPLPLTQAAHVTRGLTLGDLHWTMALSLLALLAYAAVTLPLAMRLMSRRLVK